MPQPFTLLPIIVAWASFMTLQARADEMELTVQIPRIDVSEYHRPYVAIWLQDEDRKVIRNLAVWYQGKGSKGDVGAKWLPDLRQWWRRSGRALELPIDGVTGPTRPAGEHTLKVSDAHQDLSKTAPRKYVLVIETVREVGGRELLEIPFAWPVSESETHQAQGKKELGKVKITVNPPVMTSSEASK